MTRAEDALRAELEERLRFEALLADLSARFVHVPADQVDRLIEEAQRRIVQALGLDRSTRLQRAEAENDLVITHAWAMPAFAAQPGLFAARDFPWVHQTLLRGGIVRFATLEELPAAAKRDRASFHLLAWTFAKHFGQALGKPVERIPQATMEAFRHYPWPGNIRELRNVIERAVILSDSSTLQVPVGSAAAPVLDAPPTLADAERTQILAALHQTGWPIRGPAGAAALLGLKPTTLESRIKKLGLQHPR
jgi:hypothetical protein